MQVGEVHLRAPLVLDGDRGDALARARLDRAHLRQSGDDFFERLRDQAFEIFGGDVVVRRDDREPWVGNRRQQVDRQFDVADEADKRKCREEHEHADGALDCESEHYSSAPDLAQATVMSSTFLTRTLASCDRVR